ncbi:hypothetical protein [Dysgonomonas sp. ZJ709]|uniref:hypothetical protein n=1 Tax=Dysgonomonas sp. ZJ709 TaxID=2709797 RepID=UPI0013EB0062|nr:hypothetical protein [Dysgonomonas sp. ZJ709]
MPHAQKIRNRLQKLACLAWETNKFDNLDPLVKIMFECVVQEISLLESRMKDIAYSAKDNLARELTPLYYLALRPAHTILQAQPLIPEQVFDRYTAFYLNTIPKQIESSGAEIISFHPVVDSKLYNIKFNYLFHRKELYYIDTVDKKSIITTTEHHSTYNKIYLGLDIDPAIIDLKGLSFYIDFPELPELHDFFELISYTKCYAGGKQLQLTQGYPLLSNKEIDHFEKNILNYYKNNYLTIKETAYVRDIPLEVLPPELLALADTEAISGLTPKRWIELQFLPNFTPPDLAKMLIGINTFPASNKRLHKQKITGEQSYKFEDLTGDYTEKFLAVDNVSDDLETKFNAVNGRNELEDNNYCVENTNWIFHKKIDLHSVMERLVHTLTNEKTAFREIDIESIENQVDKINQLLQTTSESKSENDKYYKETIARFFIDSEKSNVIDVKYWVCNGELVNGIEKGTSFMAEKGAGLDNNPVLSLVDVHGGKEFTEIADLNAVFFYLLSSRDRILTHHNITSFCKAELGRAISDVDAKRAAKISPKPHEGIINVMEIQLTPSKEYPYLIKRKGVLRDLLIRMRNRSPGNFNFNIKIKSVVNEGESGQEKTPSSPNSNM